MSYQGCVEAHNNVLIHLLPNKRSKEHIKGKPQSQKNSNSHHLHTNKKTILKITIPPPKKKFCRKEEIKIKTFHTPPEEDGKVAAIHASSSFRMNANAKVEEEEEAAHKVQNTHNTHRETNADSTTQKRKKKLIKDG